MSFSCDRAPLVNSIEEPIAAEARGPLVHSGFFLHKRLLTYKFISVITLTKPHIA